VTLDASNDSSSTLGLPPALLAMEDGTVYRGFGFGAVDGGAVSGAGEIVFNTAITGYQEVLTDPSYRGQIVTMTAPEIGNVGVNPVDFESARPWCAGFVVRELSPLVSNWRASGSLHELLAQNGVAGITGIDTRAVTRRIRLSGAQRAVITRNVADPAAAVARARNHPSLEGRDLVREVTSATPYDWDEPLWQGPRAPSRGPVETRPARHHVVAYDFGIKRGILRHLRSSGCKVTVVPAATPAREALAMKPDGVFLSNGPGDPAAVDYAVEAARELCASKLPVFGICLGHHGANHPVMDLGTRKVEITSQNHGFAVDVDSMAGKAVLSHVSLNDKTVEGMRHGELPVFSVQYHPEASPGPNDSNYLFERFRVSMEERRRR
jgi:carbamoyl-phosphate synthase small subunit